MFGGPYGNLQATQAMQEIASRLRIPSRNIICNGDLVAYCGNPEETVELIREWEIHVVKGNCEESIGDRSDDCGCGFDEASVCSALSAEWYSFCCAQVSEANRRWMAQLPDRIFFKFGKLRFAVVHGSAHSINEFVFASSSNSSKRRAVESLSVDCVIGGHSGIPFGQSLEIGYWLNSGVIGMPANDSTQDGWYLLLESKNDQIKATWHRLPFDTAQAAQAMREAGLGKAYREALATGLWPSMDILPEAEKRAQGSPLQPEPLLLQ